MRGAFGCRDPRGPLVVSPARLRAEDLGLVGTTAESLIYSPGPCGSSGRSGAVVSLVFFTSAAAQRISSLSQILWCTCNLLMFNPGLHWSVAVITGRP